MAPCGACAGAKTKQMSLPTRTETMSVVVRPKNVTVKANGRIYMDLLSMRAPKLIKVEVTKPHWLVMVDEKTRMKWSEFHVKKDDIVEPTCEKFNKWKQEGKPVEIVR